MSFRFKRNEPAEAAVRRIAREQIVDMIRRTKADSEGELHAAVHDVRKRCKKLRGLIRLVRPQFKHAKTYERENACYRDAANLLSSMRDAQSILESFDSLIQRYKARIDSAKFIPIRDRLLERRQQLEEPDSDMTQRTASFHQLMVEARDRVAQWKFRGSEFSLIASGLENSYARGKREMKQALLSWTTEGFHNWRKHAKYHWYHCRLLKDIWKGPMSMRIAATCELSELLGDDHDLSVLADTLANESIVPAEGAPIYTMIRKRRSELQLAAEVLGGRIYAEKPTAFSDRMQAYWRAWKRKAAKSDRPRFNVVGGE